MHRFEHVHQTKHVEAENNARLPAELVTLLRDSILNLNAKFDAFNSTITEKIERIERNYDELSVKITSFAPVREIRERSAHSQRSIHSHCAVHCQAHCGHGCGHGCGHMSVHN